MFSSAPWITDVVIGSMRSGFGAGWSAVQCSSIGLSFVAMDRRMIRLPLSSASTVCRGGTTVVVSICRTMAGPATSGRAAGGRGGRRRCRIVGELAVDAEGADGRVRTRASSSDCRRRPPGLGDLAASAAPTRRRFTISIALSAKWWPYSRLVDVMEGRERLGERRPRRSCRRGRARAARSPGRHSAGRRGARSSRVARSMPSAVKRSASSLAIAAKSALMRARSSARPRPGKRCGWRRSAGR